jgi:hypothetical protein
MKKLGFTFLIAAGVAAGLALSASSALAQGEKDGQGQVTVTILPKHPGDSAPAVTPQDLSIKVNGKDAKVSNFEFLRSPHDAIELVVLIDGSARNSLGTQLNEIAGFIKSLPPNIKATIGYMQNGNSQLTGPLTADHEAVLRGLHLPGGSVASNGSPYFCISDLAKRWPSNDTNARREVVMITDGVDEYNRRFDPEDPYVQAAVSDAARARLTIYSIYWRGMGRFDNTNYANNTGQNLMVIVTEATGGKNFWNGTGNPVSFEPYFEELSRRFRNQYELSFKVDFNGKPQVEGMKLKLKVANSDVAAPQQVFVMQPGMAQN